MNGINLINLNSSSIYAFFSKILGLLLIRLRLHLHQQIKLKNHLKFSIILKISWY